MLTKEDKILIKMSGNQKSTEWDDKLRNFQTRNRASVVWRTFWSDCKQWRPLNKHPVVDVCAWGIVWRPVTTLKVDILNITYDCYSQNNDVKMATQ